MDREKLLWARKKEVIKSSSDCVNGQGGKGGGRPDLPKKAWVFPSTAREAVVLLAGVPARRVVHPVRASVFVQSGVLFTVSDIQAGQGVSEIRRLKRWV